MSIRHFLSGQIQWIVQQLYIPEELSVSKHNEDQKDSCSEILDSIENTILGRQKSTKEGEIEIFSGKYFTGAKKRMFVNISEIWIKSLLPKNVNFL